MNMSLMSRFEQSEKTLQTELLKQKFILNNIEIAKKVMGNGSLASFKTGEVIIEQGSYDQDIYFLRDGEVEIIINGKKLPYTRSPGISLGEMSAISPTKPRSATLIAKCDIVTFKITADFFDDLLQEYSEISHLIAVDLSERLEERNQLIDPSNQKSKLFIISTVESLGIAQQIKHALDYDDIEVTIWNESGVFNAGSYTVESLEKAVKESDFGLAIMQGDDIINTRGIEHSVPRDNVVFELGLFMGHLTRSRTLLALPRGTEIKVASDLNGLTPLEYKFNCNGEAEIGNLVFTLRKHIESFGPRVTVNSN